MPFKAQSFKCRSESATAVAYCNTCGWDATRDKSTKIVRQAKRHTENTGHETRIDITRQRGYRLHPVQPADASAKGG